MQEFYGDVAKVVVPTVEKVISSARKAGITVVHSQHRLKRPKEDGMLSEWWDGNLVGYGTPEAELLPEVGFTEHYELVRKHVYSTFVNSDLESCLMKIGYSEVIIIGVMTSLCCETAARDAFCRGFRVFLRLRRLRRSITSQH